VKAIPLVVNAIPPREAHPPFSANASSRLENSFTKAGNSFADGAKAFTRLEGSVTSLENPFTMETMPFTTEGSPSTTEPRPLPAVAGAFTRSGEWLTSGEIAFTSREIAAPRERLTL
jgi:hypothetical protein